MVEAQTAERPKRVVKLELPDKLQFLTRMHRYKICYGGRGGSKSWSYADTLLVLGMQQKLRVLCCREIQRSIKDSVHKLLADRIEALGLNTFYQVLETEIRSANGTEFLFAGLGNQTIDSIKSFEGVDVAWVEEAQSVSKRSFDILIPTIRAPNSEIWISFNPDMTSDEVWRRFIETPHPNAVVVKMNWSDNPWFPDTLEDERLHCQRTAPEDYANIWEGECRTAVAGAIYAREVVQMIEEGRYRALPYDPMHQVHTVWDLGWNDAMTVIMVQRPSPSVVNVINYFEDSFRRYDEIVAMFRTLGYNWGVDWLPHDGLAKNPQTGRSAIDTLKALGRNAIPISKHGLDREVGIRNARMMFPRVYIDNGARKASSGFLGAARLVDALKRYKRNIPTTTGEPSTPAHDEFSHGADAFRYLATVVERIEDDVYKPQIPVLAPYYNPNPSMGCLG